MRKLTEKEIKYFANILNFTEEDAVEITTLFFMRKYSGNVRMSQFKFDTVSDYINEWEHNWCRFSNFRELINSELWTVDGLTEEECCAELGETIFQLTSGKYIQNIW